MDKDKITNSIFEELKNFIIKYFDDDLLNKGLIIKPNKQNLFDIRYNGYIFLLQFYFKEENQNQFPYLLLGIIKGYIVEGSIDIEYPASIISIERFDIDFIENEKVFFLSQESKKKFDNFQEFIIPWLTEISKYETLKKV